MSDATGVLAGLRVVLGLAVEFAGPIYEAIVARHEPGNTVVGAHGLDLGSRIAEETHGIPFANLHLAPLPLRTMHEGPAMPYGSLSPGVPRWLKRCVYSLADSWVIDPIVARPLNNFRRQLGLAPVRGVYADWWLSSRLGLALFPDWFGEYGPLGIKWFYEEAPNPFSCAAMGEAVSIVVTFVVSKATKPLPAEHIHVMFDNQDA